MQPAGDVQLGGLSLGDTRHVCALVDGPDEGWSLMRPFVLDGLRDGSRVLYLTESPTAFLERLPSSANTGQARTSGQLVVRSWSDSYLAGGRFRSSRAMRDLRRAIRDGASLGFGTTRIIGEMEWAQEGTPGVEELVRYESAVDAAFRRSPHAVVCVYDVRFHSASRIAAVLGAHQAAFVGGQLQRRDGRSGRPAARERILATASELFTKHGLRATGVDALIGKAEVAKATFYRHFPSKDDLIVAWLRDSRTRWLDDVRQRVKEEATSPDDVIPRFFSALIDWLSANDFRGCPYLNASAEIADRDHPAVKVIRSYLDEVQRYLADALTAARYRDASALAVELQSMIAGAIVLGVAHRTTAYALAAREGAARLLEGAARD